MDEASKQLLRDAREGDDVCPGRAQRVDDAYKREGVANLFLVCEPLRGQRWVDGTAQRTRADWAYQGKELGDVRYPEAERIVLGLDNLNTHSVASLYEVFPPAQAKRLADKLEIHYTPTHGRWSGTLGVLAEIELSVLSRQWLERRVPALATLAAEIAAREARRNAAGGRIDWRFTTDDARITLKRLYPSIHE